jgi:hypothetical protein
MRKSSAALADWEDEDEWTRADEEELSEMISAEVSTPIHADILGSRAARQELPHSLYPLYEIKASGLHLSFAPPLTVTIETEEEDGGVIVSSPELRIWGVGQDTYGAVRDFSSTLVNVLRSYEQTPRGELTGDAQEYLALLHSFISRRDDI